MALNRIPAASASANIVQTSVTARSTLATTGGTFSDIPSLSATITPSTASKKVLITLSVSFANGVSYTNVTPTPMFKLMRDSTAIGIGDTDASAKRATFALGNGAFGYYDVSHQITHPWNGGWTYEPGYAGSVIVSYSYLDSPATTSATTYKLQYTDAYLSYTSVFNGPTLNAGASYTVATASTIILEEK